MKVSATHPRALSTFLLEMALDEARLRQRLAQRLLAEREKRGGGYARRFPQPRMAELLGVTLRTYQDWEGGTRVPTWRNLEEVSDRLEIPVADLVGRYESPEPEVTPSAADSDRLDRVERRVDETLAEVRSLRTELAEALQGLTSGGRASTRRQ